MVTLISHNSYPLHESPRIPVESWFFPSLPHPLKMAKFIQSISLTAMHPFAPQSLCSRNPRQITPGKPVTIPEGNLSTKNWIREVS
jgi:hypothetical protein